jgi:hypothetical protein
MTWFDRFKDQQKQPQDKAEVERRLLLLESQVKVLQARVRLVERNHPVRGGR